MGVLSYALLFTASIVLYTSYCFVYNVFFHPLKHIPGPKLAAASGIPYTLKIRSGNIGAWTQELHEKYGEVVRIAPADVSFISGSSWQDIYGHRVGKHKNIASFGKDRSWFPMSVNGAYTIVSADNANHTRFRKNLSNGFSDKALRAQEPLIQGYLDSFLDCMHGFANEGTEVDIMSWYNYLTFDIISGLLYGEPVDCLHDVKARSWVDLILSYLGTTTTVATNKRYPIVALYDRVMSIYRNNMEETKKTRQNLIGTTHAKVARRLEQDTQHPDLFSYILKNQDDKSKALTRTEMDSNSQTLLIAGSETTATTMSGITYLLLTHPAVYAKLVHEVRTKFATAAEINIEEASKLEYMQACIQETMRVYPPIAAGFPRMVPPGGAVISGNFISAGTSVSMSQFAAYHSTRHFKDPLEYVPERWLGDPKYKDDNRDIVHPFSVGPRNCVGQNLAWAELRLILARLTFNFDLELMDTSKHWMTGQKIFALWNKPALKVKLHPVEH